MDTLYETGVIVLMFILRLGLPLLVTVAIVYWLRRLDARWQAEALQERSSISVAPIATTIKPLPSPCWIVRSCPEEKRNHCPAYAQPELACWSARKQADGRLPSLCLTCLLFKPTSPQAIAAQ